MKTLAVIVNEDKSGTRELLPALIQHAKLLEIKLLFETTEQPIDSDQIYLPCEELFSQADAVLTLGGDGTLLSAVRRMGDHPLPLLGINFGKLGFLTSVTQDQMPKALDAWINDDLVPSSRQLLECTFQNPGEEPQQTRVLNDVVMSWGKSSHIANLDVSVNGQQLTTYTCDGLIISTPTGSTGHSLSAGGPILSPETDSLVLSPICPHSMTVRPVVLAGNSELDIRLAPHSKSLVLACDGQPMLEMVPGATLKTKFCALKAELLQMPDYNYWEVLRNKLHWRGSSVE
ncbi:NAD(+)/NADH kinase [Kiritimatiellota bacterium B12222]|nr:NAD(+)/NADH kinase [Kiritimatiellota bacterium B12222]